MIKPPAVLVALTLLSYGCGTEPADTCSDGVNMRNVVVGTFDALAVDPLLVLGWSAGTGRGAELPEAYFDAATFAPDQTIPSAHLLRIEDAGVREIGVRFQDLGSYLGTLPDPDAGPLEFTLEFPDRREHIDCEHPGMADRYFLDVSVTLDGSGGVGSASFIERRSLGDI